MINFLLTVLAAFVVAIGTVAKHIMALMLSPLGSWIEKVLRLQTSLARWWLVFFSLTLCVLVAVFEKIFLSRFVETSGNSAILTFSALSLLALSIYRQSALIMLRDQTEYKNYTEMLEHLSVSSTKWFQNKLRRPEDGLWIRLMMATTVIHVPPTIAVLAIGDHSIFTLLWFIIALFSTFKTPAMNHNLGHNNPFLKLKKEHPTVGLFLVIWYHFVVEFVEGDIPHLTIAAHNIVHHGENNGLDDFETTLPYDRTSFVSTSKLFVRCGLAYTFGIGVLSYLWSKRKNPAYRRGLKRAITGLTFTYGILAVSILNVGVPVVVFILTARLIQSTLKFGQLPELQHSR